MVVELWWRIVITQLRAIRAEKAREVLDITGLNEMDLAEAVEGDANSLIKETRDMSPEIKVIKINGKSGMEQLINALK